MAQVPERRGHAADGAGADAAVLEQAGVGLPAGLDAAPTGVARRAAIMAGWLVTIETFFVLASWSATAPSSASPTPRPW